MTDCPVCQFSHTRRAFVVDGFPLCDCGGCGHRFADYRAGPAHVGECYGDDYFTEGNAGYADYLAEAELLRRRGHQYAEKIGLSPGRVLDVGAAAGFLLQGMTDAGWHGVGVEPNHTMAAHAREQLGLAMVESAFDDFRDPEPFDLVTMIQVIAHLPDPLASLQRVSALLHTGGHLLVETWDRDSVFARLCGQRWHEYSPPTVLHWFSRRSLNDLAGRAGLVAVASGRMAKWIRVQHARSLLAYKYSGSFLGRCIDRGLAPFSAMALPYIADDLFWTLYRKAT